METESVQKMKYSVSERLDNLPSSEVLKMNVTVDFVDKGDNELCISNENLFYFISKYLRKNPKIGLPFAQQLVTF